MTLNTKQNDWSGTRVTVMGLGLFGGGVGAARFAASRGASVTVTDLRGADDLTESVEALDDVDVRFVLGRHDESDFVDADLIIVNPAVPRDATLLQAARDTGVPLTTEMLLFVERCKGRVIAVTGSNGKTTTTSIIGAIMTAYDSRTVVGGNLGRSLLDVADEIEARAPVVLELSSFQLEWLGEVGWAPTVGVITNLSPNHLDRHGTYENYVAAKRQLLANQISIDNAVLNASDELLRDMAGGLPGQITWFDRNGTLEFGTWVEDGTIMRCFGGDAEAVMHVADISLPGLHNLENVLAAIAAVSTDQSDPVDSETITQAVSSFHGVEHRLEFVREVGGVRYYNDSISTTPESAIAALRSFDAGSMVLIAGGYDKKIPFDALGAEIADRSARLVVYGATADKIADAALSAGMPNDMLHRAENLDEAVEIASGTVQPGQHVVLSPACASYDQFRNFAERGERFKHMVNDL